MTDRRKRSWKNLLLDVRYQVAFSLPMVLLAAALFAGLGYAAMRKVEAATKVGIHQLDEAGAAYVEDAAELKAELLRRERVIRWGVIASGVLLCLCLFLFGVMLTHRVAGPLHRIGAALHKLGQGSLEPLPRVRHSDELVDFHEQFLSACEALRSREGRDVELYRRVVEAAEREPELEGAVERLRACLRAKESGLG